MNFKLKQCKARGPQNRRYSPQPMVGGKEKADEKAYDTVHNKSKVIAVSFLKGSGLPPWA